VGQTAEHRIDRYWCVMTRPFKGRLATLAYRRFDLQAPTRPGKRIRFWVVAVGRLPMLLWACSTDPWRVQSHRHLTSGGGEIVEIFLPSEIVVS
jgi:hypothetical protein